MKNTLFLLIALLPPALQAQQQQVIASGGQEISAGRFVLTATFGETCVNVCTGDAEYVSEGFQQGFPDAPAAIILSAGQGEASRLQAAVFPNPAVDRLQVSLRNPDGKALRLQIFNRLGALVVEVETSSEGYAFNVAALPAGHYWLTILSTEASPKAITLPFEKIKF